MLILFDISHDTISYAEVLDAMYTDVSLQQPCRYIMNFNHSYQQ